VRRLAAGAYVTLDGRYRADRWDDRRRVWVVSEIQGGDALILSEHRTLADARAQVDRLEREAVEQ